jgi:multidrug efflux pump
LLVENNKDVSSIISNVTVGVTDPQDEDQGEYTNKGKNYGRLCRIWQTYRSRKLLPYLDQIRKAVKGIPGAEITVAKEQGGPPTAKAYQH